MKSITIMKEKIIQVEDCFNINGYESIAFLKHSHDGLPSKTKLASCNNGLIWLVVSRLIDSFNVDSITKFSSETEEIQLFRFISLETKMEAIRTATQRDRENIFQYKLKAYKHKSKLLKGEKLLIKAEK